MIFSFSEVIFVFVVSFFVVFLATIWYFRNYSMVLKSAHCGNVKGVKINRVQKLVPNPKSINTSNWLFIAKGDSAIESKIYHNDTVLIEEPEKYSAGDMVVIFHKNDYKIRKLISNTDKKWVTYCANQGNKSHDECNFVGIVSQVYSNKNWQAFKNIAA